MKSRIEKCHFDLDLNAAKCRDRHQLKFRITTLKLHDLEQVPPLQLAIRNLLGVLYYYLGQYHKAYESFCQVLKDDSNNLNALENIARVCFRLQNSGEEREYRERYDIIINNCPDRLISARFRAEHAFAHAFECYLETNELRRYHKSNEIYLECLEMTSQIPEMNEERAQWLMCMVWNYKKLFNRNFTMDRSKEGNEDFYPKILATLYNILDLVPNDKYLSSLAYGYLGYFFWKRPITPYEDSTHTKDMPIPEIVKQKGMTDHFEHPEVLFKKALENGEELETCHLYVGWLIQNQRFDESLVVLNRCVEMHPTDSNYFSYSKRGEVLYRQAKRSLSQTSKTLSCSVIEILDKAISDFEFVATVNPTSYIFSFLASTYFLRSDKGTNRQMKANCLAAFERGLVCLDGRHDPRIHANHAECLKSFGETEHALDASKRCIESQYPKTKYTENIEFLLNEFIVKMASGSSEVVAKIIPDVVHWFRVAFHKYDRCAFKTMFTKLIKTQCKAIDIGLFSHVLVKQDGEINQFLAEVLNQPEVISSCREYFDSKLIAKMFSIGNIVEPIKAVSQSKNLQPRNRAGFDYDFFVIYSAKDRDWVLFSLLNYLEKTRGFKGFIDDRDFTPGVSIFENIEHAISKSYKFIPVITSNFLESNWCKHESQAALTDALNKKESSGIVIPIVKDQAEVPEFLKLLHHIRLEESVNEFQYERLAMALAK